MGPLLKLLECEDCRVVDFRLADEVDGNGRALRHLRLRVQIKGEDVVDRIVAQLTEREEIFAVSMDR
jgi:hypothetical protein